MGEGEGKGEDMGDTGCISEDAILLKSEGRTVRKYNGT